MRFLPVDNGVGALVTQPREGAGRACCRFTLRWIPGQRSAEFNPAKAGAHLPGMTNHCHAALDAASPRVTGDLVSRWRPRNKCGVTNQLISLLVERRRRESAMSPRSGAYCGGRSP